MPLFLPVILIKFPTCRNREFLRRNRELRHGNREVTLLQQAMTQSLLRRFKSGARSHLYRTRLHYERTENRSKSRARSELYEMRSEWRRAQTSYCAVTSSTHHVHVLSCSQLREPSASAASGRHAVNCTGRPPAITLRGADADAAPKPDPWVCRA
jgi:hypothetical protein